MVVPSYEVINQLRVQKGTLRLPPGSEVGETRTVHNPGGCCTTTLTEGTIPPPGFDVELTTIRVPSAYLETPLASPVCYPPDKTCCNEITGCPCAGDTVFPQLLYCHIDYFAFDAADIEALYPGTIAFFDQWFPMYYFPDPPWGPSLGGGLLAGEWRCFACTDRVFRGNPHLPEQFFDFRLFLSGAILTSPPANPVYCFGVQGEAKTGGFGITFIQDYVELIVADSTAVPFYQHWAGDTGGSFVHVYISE